MSKYRVPGVGDVTVNNDGSIGILDNSSKAVGVNVVSETDGSYTIRSAEGVKINISTRNDGLNQKWDFTDINGKIQKSISASIQTKEKSRL